MVKLRMSGEPPVRIGISACLLGHAVRYDGGCKHDPVLVGRLGDDTQFEPVCPETECGLGVPREAMRLVGDPEQPRLVTIRDGIDQTGRMLAWATARLDELATRDLGGFIFKARSPSCGLTRIRVVDERGAVTSDNGVGIFARLFMRRFPFHPVAEEDSLQDRDLLERFSAHIRATRCRIDPAPEG